MRRVCTSASASAHHIRRAQAVEVLRSEFLLASRAGMTMQVQDLDDVVRESRIRPSALLPVYGLVGSALGSLALAIPQSYSSALTKVVHDVAEQSLNDSIRDLASVADCGDDVRETLKYHRDLRSSVAEPSSNAAGLPPPPTPLAINSRPPRLCLPTPSK